MEETIDGLSATVKTFSSLPMSKETQLQDLEKKIIHSKGFFRNIEAGGTQVF